MKTPHPKETVAAAIREVVALVQEQIDAGKQSTAIDAKDLVAVLLAIADRLTE